MAAAAQAEYDRKFHEMGFEYKYEYKQGGKYNIYIPSKFLTKRYWFSEKEKQIRDAQEFGLVKKIFIPNYAPLWHECHKEIKDLMSNSDYMYVQSEHIPSTTKKNIHYIPTGAKASYWDGTSIESLEKFKAEQDKILKQTK